MDNAIQVGFTVEPDFIVKYARDQVLSKNWRGALRTLTTSTTKPLTMEQALSILKGEQTLAPAPDGQLHLVPQPQDDKHYQFYMNTARWQQAGIFERDGEFYQPYAEVSKFTRADRDAVVERLREDEDCCAMDYFVQQCTRRYMDNPYDDIIILDAGENPVLMKRVQGPAFWVKTFDEPADAVADFLTERNLEDRGQDGQYNYSMHQIELYLEAVIDGLVYVSVSDIDVGRDNEILQVLGEMREQYEEDRVRMRRRAAAVANGSDDDDETDNYRPTHGSDYAYENAAKSAFWRSRVLPAAEANGGFLDIETIDHDGEKKTYSVARNPFTLWARQYGFKHGELPEWTRVCPSGLKMMSDNPMHTDWWVSSGLPLRAAYDHDHPLNKAAWKVASMWQDTEGSKCLKLAGSGKVTGPVVFPGPNEAVPAGSIAVVSHAGPEYQTALMSACKGKTGALVSAVGGKMAHLAIVSRELNMRLAVVDEALTKFKAGELVTIDFDTGDVKIHGRNSRFAKYDD